VQASAWWLGLPTGVHVRVMRDAGPCAGRQFIDVGCNDFCDNTGLIAGTLDLFADAMDCKVDTLGAIVASNLEKELLTGGKNPFPTGLDGRKTL